MTDSRRRRGPISLATAMLCATLLAGCARQESRDAAGGAARGADGPSIYELDLRLVDADGEPRRLADLRDTVRVAAMMYTSCRSVCPRVTEDIQAIARQLGRERRARVGFVLFSLDPGRDSPEALRAFAREHGLDRTRWRLFTGTEDDIRTLAAVLGVQYRPEGDGEIAHSAMIFVIDGDGVLRHRQEGLGQDPGALLTAVREAR